MNHQRCTAFGLAALALPLLAGRGWAQPGSFQEQRQLMRQVTQQLQTRLEQRLRCINQANGFTDLEECQRTYSTGWHHGPGMGGWGCPIW